LSSQQLHCQQLDAILNELIRAGWRHQMLSTLGAVLLNVVPQTPGQPQVVLILRSSSFSDIIERWQLQRTCQLCLSAQAAMCLPMSRSTLLATLLGAMFSFGVLAFPMMACSKFHPFALSRRANEKIL
jgi:hypothetical protein